MNFAIATGLSVLMAVLLRRHPGFLVGIYLTVCVALPYSVVGADIGTQTLLGLHPASFIAIALFAITIVRYPSETRRVIESRPTLLVLMGTLSMMLVITLSGTGFPQMLINQYLAPFLALLCLLVSEQVRPGSARRIVYLILVLAAVESLLGIAEAVARENLYFIAEHRSYGRFTLDFARPMGTTSHPLVYGAFLASAIPLTLALRSTILQVACVGLFGAAVLFSETRTSLVVAAIAIAYVVMRSRIALWGRALLSTAVLAGALAVAVNASSLGVFARFANDNNSGLQRQVALDWFLDHFEQLPLIGPGIGTSFGIASEAGLTSSFESSVIQMVIEFGLVPALFVIGAILIQLMFPSGPGRIPGAAPATLALLATTVTFSSLSVETLLGPLLMILIAVSLVREHTPARGPAPSVPALTVETGPRAGRTINQRRNQTTWS